MPLVSYAASVLQVGCSFRFARTCMSEWYCNSLLCTWCVKCWRT